ncbi:hypothetical protein OQA88_10904 [Cercophora sp. LCS_1]
MFLARHVRTVSPFAPKRSAFRTICRCYVTRQSRQTEGEDYWRAPSEVAQRLRDTGVWTSKARGSKNKPISYDKYRVNIADKKLVDDVLEYMKPSLLRHQGCDILDMSPGAGVWSQGLHDLLQPRSHIMMDPDAELYKPFLKPLLGKPGVKLVAKNGIIWRDLNQVLTPEFFPHQSDRGPPSSSGPPQQRNDTLLVTANLVLWPRRRFKMFDSISLMVVFQLLSAIRTAALFHKYGLVRMLLWVHSEDARIVLPNSATGRRRAAIEAELNTEWMEEVCGPDNSDAGRYGQRDPIFDLYTSQKLVADMAARGIVIPPGRETQLVQRARALGDEPLLLGEHGTRARFRGLQELEELIALAESGGGLNEKLELRRRRLQYYYNWRKRRDEVSISLIKERDAISRVYQSRHLDEAKRMDASWNDKIERMTRDFQLDFGLMRDNHDLFAHKPRILSWDRRTREPLVISNDEMFPNVPCSLLDIQPKAPHPLLLERGPNSTRSGDMWEMLMRGMQAYISYPISKALDKVTAGAADGVLPYCPSISDASKGGCSVSGFGEPSPRVFNEEQLMELLDAWMQWPFKPTLHQLIGSMTEDALGDAGAERTTGRQASGANVTMRGF